MTEFDHGPFFCLNIGIPQRVNDIDMITAGRDPADDNAEGGEFMGFLKNAFGDNRVLAAKNPEVQKMLTYMDKKYSASIIEYTERKGNWYVLRCGSKKYFDFLYHNGFLNGGGSINIPDRGSIFYSKTEAYEGLVWLYKLLEEQESNSAKDKEWF